MTATCARPAHVMPLEHLLPEYQAEVARLVALPKPPQKWVRVGLCWMVSRAWSEWHWQRGHDPHSRRPTIPKRLREAVYERDGHKCLRCGSTERLSLDHVAHWSTGGSDTYDNLRTLCLSCNSERRARTDVEWLGAEL